MNPILNYRKTFSGKRQNFLWKCHWKFVEDTMFALRKRPLFMGEITIVLRKLQSTKHPYTNTFSAGRYIWLFCLLFYGKRYTRAVWEVFDEGQRCKCNECIWWFWALALKYMCGRRNKKKTFPIFCIHVDVYLNELNYVYMYGSLISCFTCKYVYVFNFSCTWFTCPYTSVQSCTCRSTSTFPS